MKHLVALLALATVCYSCTAAKRKGKKNKQEPVTEARKQVYVDTLTAAYDLTPDEGYTYVVENMQIYVLAKQKPNVGFAVRQADGSRRIHILSHLSNEETYSFGGGVHYEIKPGEKGVLEIFDGNTSKPLKSRIIIMGYQQKK